MVLADDIAHFYMRSDLLLKRSSAKHIPHTPMLLVFEKIGKPLHCRKGHDFRAENHSREMSQSNRLAVLHGCVVSDNYTNRLLSDASKPLGEAR